MAYRRFVHPGLIPIAVVALAALACAANGSAAAIDVVADTYHVVDGDTIDAFPVGRIRLADIDTPESGQPGYTEAKNAVIGYAADKRVYLDVDEVDVDDPYNRLVAVVYVRHNATHLLNVNKALVDADLAVVDDFVNEFDPASWSLYIRVSGPELPTLWEEARAEFAQVTAELSATQGDLQAAQSDIAAAEAERDAALAELARFSAYLNGTVPAAAEVMAELNATRAELAAVEEDLATTEAQLHGAEAAQASAEAQRAADRAALQAEVAGANSSASLALWGGILGAGGAGLGAFLVGRRSARA